MKNIKAIMVFLLLFFQLTGIQAQVWKDLQKAAQKKAIDKANKKVQNQIDTTFNDSKADQGYLMGFEIKKVDVSTVPDSYSFDYKYIMEIKSDGGEAMNAEYLLVPNASYFAFNMKQDKGDSMLMIMDVQKQIMISCFGNGKEKTATASKMPDYSKAIDKQNASSPFTYKVLPNKTFLGYDCKGIEAVNDEYKMIFYYTNDAKVSFSDIFKSQKHSKIPDALTAYFKPDDKPLMMDMTMTDMKKKGKVTTMKCVSLEKSPYVFEKSDYKFL
jgi:hypothetical protein